MKKALFVSLVLIFLFPGAALAQRMAVSANEANVRSGPGTGYDILWKVEKFHPFEVRARQDGWVRVRDFEGDEAWIHQDLLNDTQTVITKAEKVNVRSGPGTGHSVVFRAERGVPFQVVSRQGAWVQIRHADGDRGWIHGNLLW
ncbi:MAG: SH3 domain-containing protein [Desulfatibacillaceae bacterium]|nr:SH3 domain-containing protein [Desulfatibacillaceae bacterium]